jgi:uncharacterized protein (TIGR02246 family)
MVDDLLSIEEGSIRFLYNELLQRWNKRNAVEMADLFTEKGNIIGFDGSQLNGRSEIKSQLFQIFVGNLTAEYIGKVRNVRFLTSEIAVLCAVAGMIPPKQSDINPVFNTIQTLVAIKIQGQWNIEVFQNTPAAFHGNPELYEQLTEELRQVLNKHRQRLTEHHVS